MLQLQSVSKSFGGVHALKRVDLEIHPGQVVGLIGENGAGKTTLIKILSGVVRPDEGNLIWKGEPRLFHSPHEALRAGIATIHQELAFCSTLTVAENLLLGHPWPRHPWGAVRWNSLFHQADRMIRDFGIEIPSRRFFHQLSPVQKQEIAIIRALSEEQSLLILDEPTASLSEPEVKRLFQHLANLQARGVGILYVSHRLDEIMHLTQQVAVLRDGVKVAEYPTKDADVPRMIRDMVGRPVEQVFARSRQVSPGPPMLELDRLARRPFFHDVTLHLRAGEIVGLAGLVGAGRSELARALYGLYPLDGGKIRLNGADWTPSSPRHALDSGIIYLPEERKRHGLVLEHSVRDNISIGFNDRLSRVGLVRGQMEYRQVAEALQRYRVRAGSSGQPVGTLSGGNQQKTLLARWLERDPDILILDEPTRGVDVGAKVEIHRIMDELAGQGRAILLISSDLPEILGMSDRLYVMHAGRITAELAGEGMTQENVLTAASGLPLKSSGAGSISNSNFHFGPEFIG